MAKRMSQLEKFLWENSSTVIILRPVCSRVHIGIALFCAQLVTSKLRLLNALLQQL